MEKNFLLIINIMLLIVIVHEVKSQDTITIFFDEQWQECDKKQSSYYRKYWKTELNQYNVQDFYNSGQLQMEGTYNEQNWNERIDHFIYYYDNGQKESEGDYNDDERNGKWIKWWDNSQKKSEGEFSHNKLTGKWITWHENGAKESEGEYFDSKRTGKWNGWHENGNLKHEAEYKNDDLISLLKEFDEDGNFLIEYAFLKLLDNYYYDYLISVREFEDFKRKNIKYPEVAKKLDQQVKVILYLYINPNGDVYDVEVLKGASEEIDNEAIRVVKLYKWPKPIYMGKEVFVWFRTQFKFTL